MPTPHPLSNLSFLVVPQNAPPSAAGGGFGASRFFVENLGKAQIFSKQTARSIRFSSRRSRVLIPQNLDYPLSVFHYPL
ncbi:MAG: hypothetical protein U5L45_06050 [Saprospiraceae bacterium]|nr:hypothetical protein [Saprospiraceae bacterium]